MAKAQKPLNLLDLYKPEEKTAHSETLGIYIKYRHLTRKENADFKAELLNGYDKETGNPIFNIDKVDEVNVKKACAMLIEPAVTLEELDQIDANIADGLVSEVLALSGEDGDQIDEEGN